MHVGVYKRTPETTNYNASASGASGVSNEMQEVRARVVRCDARLKEREHNKNEMEIERERGRKRKEK